MDELSFIIKAKELIFDLASPRAHLVPHKANSVCYQSQLFDTNMVAEVPNLDIPRLIKRDATNTIRLVNKFFLHLEISEDSNLSTAHVWQHCELEFLQFLLHEPYKALLLKTESITWRPKTKEVAFCFHWAYDGILALNHGQNYLIDSWFPVAYGVIYD